MAVSSKGRGGQGTGDAGARIVPGAAPEFGFDPIISPIDNDTYLRAWRHAVELDGVHFYRSFA